MMMSVCDQVPRCLILKTSVNCHCQLVLHSFRDIKPVQFIMQKTSR